MPDRIRTKLDFGSSSRSAKKKLRELVLYIAQKCADDERFGATKLNKILLFADFMSYMERGRSITGAQYFKLEHGPAPKHMIGVKQELFESGDADEIEMIYKGRLQKRLVAKRKANLDDFTAEDIAFLDEIIEGLSRATATHVSEISHNIIWEIAELKQNIPYEAVFLSDRKPTKDDYEWARKIIKNREKRQNA